MELKSISKILAEIGISEEKYENALKISDDNDFQLHLRRRLTDSCFINNYFGNDLLTLEEIFKTEKSAANSTGIYKRNMVNIHLIRPSDAVI